MHSHLQMDNLMGSIGYGTSDLRGWKEDIKYITRYESRIEDSYSSN